MELWLLFLRTILVYFVVFTVLRIMGKREIGKLSVFDLVISIIIADIAVLMIEETKMSLIEGLLPIGVLVLVQILAAYLSMKNEKLRVIFDGKPSILIENGRINWREMQKQRYTLDDLLIQSRLQNVNDISKIAFAILETNGNLSIMKKRDLSSEQNSNESDENSQSKQKGPKLNVSDRLFPLPLIKDGKLQKRHLEKLGKDEAWLRQVLKERGCERMDQVLYCSLTTEGNLFLQLK